MKNRQYPIRLIFEYTSASVRRTVLVGVQLYSALVRTTSTMSSYDKMHVPQWYHTVLVGTAVHRTCTIHSTCTSASPTVDSRCMHVPWDWPFVNGRAECHSSKCLPHEQLISGACGYLYNCPPFEAAPDDCPLFETKTKS